MQQVPLFILLYFAAFFACYDSYQAHLMTITICDSTRECILFQCREQAIED